MCVMDDTKIQEQRQKIKRYQEAYYNLCPLVSDAEYDAELEVLKRDCPDAPEIKKVGAPPPTHSIWEKVKHQIPMGSLSKANSEQEFLEWVQKTSTTNFFITHKIDGSSMELIYKAGKLARCVTRGDGVIGEDVTENVRQVPNIPEYLGKNVDATVRGEIIMTKKVFEEIYSEEYANPRNTAAAKVREKKKSGIDCQNLVFLAYWLSEGKSSGTMLDMFSNLNKSGFQTPEHLASFNIEDMKAEFASVKLKRPDIPYEIDGVVVSSNNLEHFEELGDLNMRPRGQIAWKFDALVGITTMVDVKWQVGPSGRVTPVAVVAPVGIGGVTITNISLHNLSIFRDLKLWKGCRVLISRRNDVIPYVEKNLDLPETA